jgi:hypothetical protein
MNSAFLKKNWYFFTPAAILIIPALMVLFCAINYGYPLAESMKSVMHFGSTSTRYSQGFTERKFKMLRVGMDAKSVFNTIRTPMERNMPDDTEWRFSLPGSGAGYYHERTLIMERDKNGIPRVKQRISRFNTLD